MPGLKTVSLGAVFTSDGVGVGVVVGVVRDLMTWRKSKIGVLSGVISSTGSELEESERFHLFDSVYDSVGYDPVKTKLSESKAKPEEPANRKARSRPLSLIYSSASDCDFDNVVFT